MNQDITLTVDYHDKHCVIRQLDHATSEERVMTVPTLRLKLERVIRAACSVARPRGGQVTSVRAGERFADASAAEGQAQKDGQGGYGPIAT
jgi:hypothetical protein